MSPLMVMKSITYVMGVMFAAYATYYVVFAVLSLKKRAPFAPAAPRHRFAVLIAARNEAQVIGQLVDSLHKQAYPKELFDIIVVPNNCTDDTAGVARRAGARVLQIHAPVRSKGEVLSQAYRQLQKGPAQYDALCVFDADNLVDSGFLAAMNDALCAGVRVAQGCRDSKNPYDTYMSSCYSIYYWLVNQFFNQARTVVGLSAMINGSGFMVSWSLLEQMGGWNTLTMTEDLEFTAQCVLH
ncbi:MAG: glycosyltransferase family 2 protein, partial [Eubacteriales bacterium]|nr:glycosyltransferase family 2 protein [Eubacteriales bacterium]